MNDGIVLAKDITSCDECPLKAVGCKGITQFREPLCFSWDDDTEVDANKYLLD